MSGLIAARTPEEGDHDQPRHVKRGQQRGESAERENRRVAFIGEQEESRPC